MVQASTLGGGFHAAGDPSESLYERFPWLYAFCRDHLFRDDTEKISAALWPSGSPPAKSSLLELGCGPGFYARRLAARHDHLRITGIDRSGRQLRRARSLAAVHRLRNCAFEEGDALDLDHPGGSVDAVVVSRLLLVLSDREGVLAEIHRVLKPGGRCFIAEPRSALRAAAPLGALHLIARLDALRNHPRGYREPGRIAVLDTGDFKALIGSQPWSGVRHWQDTWYQYAVCEKQFS